MDADDTVGGHIEQAIIGDDAVGMVMPLAVAGDELERLAGPTREKNTLELIA
ncbi:MAG: hypothetical protein QF415_15355 [Candidatus Undinarchaeales archaeon]|jgi:hypothetical protein|nr:hypothetical protein [Candidatus Undinarchaeales archaeon]MDP7494445.1 hypothetical protein [Candidatus Undinarchaeales archaeon]